MTTVVAERAGRPNSIRLVAGQLFLANLSALRMLIV